MSDEDVDLETAIDAVREELESVREDLEPVGPTIEPVRADLEPVQADLEAAETEDDLDDVEEDLEPVREDLESVREEFDAVREAFDEIELPEPDEGEAEDDGEDDEDEEPSGPLADLETEYEDLEAALDDVEDEIDDVESGIDDVESGVEDKRGPYAEDVIGEVDDARSDITGTRWTEAEGYGELTETVEAFLESVDGLVDVEREIADGEDVPARLDATLEAVAGAVEDADLDPDDDAETIADLLEATDDLAGGIDDATEWSDLEVREQLRREGFYDVLDHIKDFPPEWHALKVHEKRGNVEMVLLALESLGSEYMEEHCLESLKRMGPEEAIDPMLQRAGRRDETAIAILGKIGVDDDEVVETLLDYVDSNPQLQKPAFRALGEIGTEDAVQPIANQLVADEPEVRSNAARALGLIGDTRAIEPLADVLAEDDADTVRASAAWALNRIGTAEALEAAAAYADDRSYLVQSEAEKAANV